MDLPYLINGNILFVVSLHKHYILHTRASACRVNPHCPLRAEAIHILPGKGVLCEGVNVNLTKLRG